MCRWYLDTAAAPYQGVMEDVERNVVSERYRECGLC